MKKMVVAAALVVMSMGSAVGQDVQKGENSFKKCLVCPAIGPPTLAAVPDPRKAACLGGKAH